MVSGVSRKFLYSIHKEVVWGIVTQHQEPCEEGQYLKYP